MQRNHTKNYLKICPEERVKAEQSNSKRDGNNYRKLPPFLQYKYHNTKLGDLPFRWIQFHILLFLTNYTH